MTNNELKAIAKLWNVNTPFYASEYDITGSTLSALANTYYIVEQTGKTKTDFVQLHDNIYKKIEVKEWKMKDYIPALTMLKLSEQMKDMENTLIECKASGMMTEVMKAMSELTV